MTTVRRAILSVSDKRGIVELARGLAELGVELLSTGGTARLLADAGLDVRPISDYTATPEILGGRVKALHPKIHGGLLGRDCDDDRAELAEHDIPPIDLVVVNLYPFEQTIARPDHDFREAIEHIDIGGAAMLRSAAKNQARVGVVTEIDDYRRVLDELRQQQGRLSAQTRFELACKAFALTSAYDAAVCAYLSSLRGPPGAAVERSDFPGVLGLQFELVRELRYGENPHQIAAFYTARARPGQAASGPSLAAATIVQGKALSHNNLLDLDGALRCCLEFSAPTAVVVKHSNPCGVACSDDGVAEAYRLARETDPASAFGGIVAVNREVDRALAELLVETFLECVIAPGYADDARAVLARKKQLRVLATAMPDAPTHERRWALRSIAGGLLVQSLDDRMQPAAAATVVTKRQPTPEQLVGLDFAWRVVKHVKSNAVLFARGRRTLAIGAGQMSRIDSVELCKLKARLSLADSCVASDAFFPFRDGLDAAVSAGASAVIQQGGSIRDAEVIAAADEHGVAMLHTGLRHFRH